MTRYGTSIRFLVSSALSLLGNSVAGIALPLIVLATTGDALAAGTLAPDLRHPPGDVRRLGRRRARPVQPSQRVHRLRRRLGRERGAAARGRPAMGTRFRLVRRVGRAGRRGGHPRHDGARHAGTRRVPARRHGPAAVSGAEPVHRLAHDHRGAGRGGVPHRCGRGREHAVGHGRPLAVRRRGHHHHPPRRRRRAGRRRLRDAALRTREPAEDAETPRKRGLMAAAFSSLRTGLRVLLRDDAVLRASMLLSLGSVMVFGSFQGLVLPAVLHRGRPSRTAGLRALGHVGRACWRERWRTRRLRRGSRAARGTSSRSSAWRSASWRLACFPPSLRCSPPLARWASRPGRSRRCWASSCSTAFPPPRAAARSGRRTRSCWWSRLPGCSYRRWSSRWPAPPMAAFALAALWVVVTLAARSMRSLDDEALEGRDAA